MNSENLIKRLVEKWNIGKNIKSREMEAINHQLLLRTSERKRSVVRVRGELVSPGKIARYRKHNPPGLNSDILQVRMSIPPEVEIRTPLASPIAAPDVLEIPEKIIMCIQDCISGAFKERYWISIGPLCEVKRQHQGRGAPQFFIDLFLACRYFKLKQSKNAERMLTRASTRLEEAVGDHLDETIIHVCCFIQRFAELGRLDAFALILNKAATIAKRVLHSGHPVALFWIHIASYVDKAEGAVIHPAIRVLWQSAVESFERALGPLHISAIQRRTRLISQVEASDNHEKSVADLYKLLRDCDNDPQGPDDMRPIRILMTIMVVLNNGSEAPCQKFFDVAEKALNRIQSHRSSSSLSDVYRTIAHYNIGLGKMRLGQVDAGEIHLRKAINIGRAAHGARDATVQADQATLAHWLRRWDKEEAARLVEIQLRAAREGSVQAPPMLRDQFMYESGIRLMQRYKIQVHGLTGAV